MLSDMVGSGVRHSHIMMSIGSAATPARIVQLAGDCTWPTTPAMPTAETQTAIAMALIAPSGTSGVYAPPLSCAVPYCTASAEAVRVYATQNVA
jgi:hypothetical protein